MTAAVYDFHSRRTRQHWMFAMGTTCEQVRRTHIQLAQAHGAVASYVYRHSPVNRQT